MVQLRAAEHVLQLHPQGQKKQHLLWEDLFSRPWNWWDNRHDKKTSVHPDFRHKISRHVLWLNNWYKPAWVETQMASLDVSFIQSCTVIEKIKALCDQGRLDAAIGVLQSQDSPNVVCNIDTYITILKACGEAVAHTECSKVHSIYAKWNAQLFGLVGDHLVAALVKCGALDDAYCVLVSMSLRSAHAWTAMISGHVACGQGAEALDLYCSMLKDGFQPDSCTFTNLLKACALIPNLENAYGLHADAESKGYASEVTVGSTLVSVYGKCGCIADAECVFDLLSGRNVVSWSAMLSSYIEQGQAENTLLLYRQMLEEGIHPNKQSIVMGLQACSILVEMGQLPQSTCFIIGQAFHADACNLGFALDVFVGSSLLCMYAKCRHVVEMEDVFIHLQAPDLVSWNALMSAYVEQGDGIKALQLYRQMNSEGVSPNQQTFAIAFQACGMCWKEQLNLNVNGPFGEHAALALGKAMHADAWSLGFTSNTYVGNSIISMYKKFQNMHDVQHAFYHMVHYWDQVSWNSFISACVEHGQAGKAIQIFQQMQIDGVSADWNALMIVLQACGMLSSEVEASEELAETKMTPLELGQTFYSDALKKGLNLSLFICNTALSMFGKCGSIIEAENIFVSLVERDEVSWSVMLSAYVEQDEYGKALHLYRQMQAEGVTLSQELLLIALQACLNAIATDPVMIDEKRHTQCMALEIGQALHADAYKKGCTTDNFIGSVLISIYGKCGCIEKAEAVFDGFPFCDIVLWSVMLSAYVEHDLGENALQFYKQMHEEGMRPDEHAIVMSFQACSILANKFSEGHLMEIIPLEIGRSLNAGAMRLGFGSNIFVRNAILSMYGKCGSVLEAEGTFMGTGKRDMVSWNVMLSIYVENDQGKEAFQLYLKMKEDGLAIDDITITYALDACRITGSMELCKHLHFGIVAAGLEVVPLLGRTLIRAYGCSACIVDARSVFDRLPQRDGLAWTACLTCYAQEGNGVASLHMYNEMILLGVVPNAVTFLSLLCACGRAGLIDEGMQLLDVMFAKYSIVPTVKHYAAIIDMLCRIGEFRHLECFASWMKMQANWAVWICVLDACCTYGKVELGEFAFNHAVDLDPKEGTSYVLMSSIYSSAGLQDLANEIENFRLKRCG